MIAGCRTDETISYIDTSTPPSPRNIRMLNGGGNSIHNTLLEITDYSILEVTVFSRERRSGYVFDNSRLYDFVEKQNPANGFVFADANHRIVDMGYQELTTRQLDTIWALAQNIVINDADKEIELIFQGGNSRVWLLIDDDAYFSMFSPTLDIHPDAWRERVISRDVMELTHYLIELSPIALGFR